MCRSPPPPPPPLPPLPGRAHRLPAGSQRFRCSGGGRRWAAGDLNSGRARSAPPPRARPCIPAPPPMLQDRRSTSSSLGSRGGEVPAA
eukprot:CAMPEP_0206378186 /NCGR_PEP_ID=MMETSP0294-20121207/10593_1 /ASSEMBLY_ACC=CAM_ASM_000327 /TAXON_ID=39354 /ORGANISM="Heterosigma akashiwo, Strain CCMP2393" /LENGTH=87 /DNA_ID=CAMNT_0053826785 /DNA_START=328 /DNA_END=587 /DNA_ORIENTATION=+